MRLVILHVIGDSMTYSHDVVTPVEYESAEAFLVDFEANCAVMTSENAKRYADNNVRNEIVYEFELGGRTWYYLDFYENEEYLPPTVLTIDEWFEQK